MRKKELLAGEYYVYAVLDKVSKHYQGLFIASTDQEFCRQYLPSCIEKYPLRDLQIVRIARFNDVTGELKSVIKKFVDVESYKFPHSKLSPVGENVKLSDIEETIQKTKNAILASLSEENKNEGAVNE